MLNAERPPILFDMPGHGLCEAVTLIDDDGEDTDNIEEAAAAVLKAPDGGFIVIRPQEWVQATTQ